MKLLALVLMMLMLVAVPLMAHAGDQGWMPPEWTATPPARPSVDVLQLVRNLVAKGILSEQDYAQLLHPTDIADVQPGLAATGSFQEVARQPVRNNP